MSRVSKSIKNAKIGVFFFGISILAQFYSRKIFLDHLGDDFIGLTSTLRSILSFLNLAELGIGTAIGYTLYKPLFDKNIKEIAKVVGLLRFLYRKIALIILILSILISLFFPWIFSGVDISLPVIYFAFFSFLFSALVGYYFNFHMVVLEADQKGYVVQGYLQTTNIIRLVLQSFIAYYFKSLMLWIAMELFFSVIYAWILNYRINKHYPWLDIETPKTNILKAYPEIVKKIKQLFIHKIGSFVKDGTDNILIFGLVNIQSVAFFGNYQLIFTKITGLVKMVYSGTMAGVGNLIAENDEKRIKKVFWEILTMQFFIGGFITLILYFMVPSFIELWIGKQYILDSDILLIMSIVFFVGQIRGAVEYYKNAYGLFSDTWAPIAEVIMNLIISYFLGKLWGILGIMLGTLSSLLVIVMVWKPYYLFKYGFKTKFILYWKGFFALLFVYLITIVITVYLANSFLVYNNGNFFDWILFSLKIGVFIVILYSSLLYMCIPSFRSLLKRLRNLKLK